jgi:AAA domain/Bifunctional DNA primase/polymerase, N-terminal
MMAHPSVHPLDAATRLTARGWVVFPADRPDAGAHCQGSARACRERRCGAEGDPTKRGKHPAVVERWGLLSGPLEPVTLAAWFGPADAPARVNVAIAAGPSGLLIVDDDAAGGFERYAESIGEKVPDTFTVPTHQGSHRYFTVPIDPTTGERVPVGNAPGLLAAYHCDVRGGASPSHPHGGYAVTAGSQHWSDDPGAYVPADWDAPAVEAPGWLIEAVTTPGPSGPTEGKPGRTGIAGTGHGPGLTRWDSAPRYGTASALREQYRRHCAEVTEPGNAFRWGLFLAARDGWRLVELGLLDEDELQRDMAGIVWRVWHAEPDERDIKIVMWEALDGPHGALASPWELTEAEVRERARAAGSRPAGRFARPGDVIDSPPEDPGLTVAPTSENGDGSHTTYGSYSVADAQDSTQLSTGPSTGVDIDLSSAETLAEAEIPPAPVGIEWATWVAAYTRERVRRAVVAELDATSLPELVAEDWLTFRSTPRPSYLVPRMLYRNGLSVIFGEPGSGKSYLILDIALSLATARSWQGHRLTGRDNGPGMVHYVMAEGRDINLVRAEAWEHYHDVSPEAVQGHFRVIGAGVLLTEPGIRNYLALVRKDQPDLIVLDTRNALSTAKESAGDEYGAMLRVLNTLREAAHALGCAVVLIDHSGLGDKGRARGSNAQQAGVHTEIVVTKPGDGAAGIYTARVTRNKAAGPRVVEWHWRLHELPELTAGDPDMDVPAVCVAAEPGDHRPISLVPTWRDVELTDAIRQAIDDTRTPDGKAHPGKREAKDIMRIMRAAADREEGHTQADLRAIMAQPLTPDGKPAHVVRGLVSDAVTLLKRAGMVETVARGRIRLTDEWVPGAD